MLCVLFFVGKRSQKRRRSAAENGRPCRSLPAFLAPGGGGGDGGCMRACAGLVQPALSPGYSGREARRRNGVRAANASLSHRFDVRSRPASTREARRQLGFTGDTRAASNKGGGANIFGLLLAYRASAGVQPNLSCAFVRTIREDGRLTKAFTFCLCADGHFLGRYCSCGSMARGFVASPDRHGTAREACRRACAEICRRLAGPARVCALASQKHQDKAREPSHWSDCTEWSNGLDAFRPRAYPKQAAQHVLKAKGAHANAPERHP